MRVRRSADAADTEPARRFPRVTDTSGERRAHIIASVAAIIADAGLEALSMRAVAARAGCSRGLVEHYFRSKSELVLAANRWVNDTYLQRVAHSARGLDGLAALEVRLRNLLPFNERLLDEWRVRVVFWRQASTDPHLAKEHNMTFYAVYEQILADMQRAQALGEIPPEVPVIETSEFVLLALMGLATSALAEKRMRRRQPLERRITMLLNLLRTGHVSALVVGDPAVEF